MQIQASLPSTLGMVHHIPPQLIAELVLASKVQATVVNAALSAQIATIRVNDRLFDIPAPVRLERGQTLELELLTDKDRPVLKLTDPHHPKASDIQSSQAKPSQAVQQDLTLLKSGQQISARVIKVLADQRIVVDAFINTPASASKPASPTQVEIDISRVSQHKFQLGENVRLEVVSNKPLTLNLASVSETQPSKERVISDQLRQLLPQLTQGKLSLEQLTKALENPAIPKKIQHHIQQLVTPIIDSTRLKRIGFLKHALESSGTFTENKLHQHKTTSIKADFGANLAKLAAVIQQELNHRSELSADGAKKTSAKAQSLINAVGSSSLGKSQQPNTDPALQHSLSQQGKAPATPSNSSKGTHLSPLTTVRAAQSAAHSQAAAQSQVKPELGKATIPAGISQLISELTTQASTSPITESNKKVERDSAEKLLPKSAQTATRSQSTTFDNRNHTISTNVSQTDATSLQRLKLEKQPISSPSLPAGKSEVASQLKQPIMTPRAPINPSVEPNTEGVKAQLGEQVPKSSQSMSNKTVSTSPPSAQHYLQAMQSSPIAVTSEVKTDTGDTIDKAIAKATAELRQAQPFLSPRIFQRLTAGAIPPALIGQISTTLGLIPPPTGASENLTMPLSPQQAMSLAQSLNQAMTKTNIRSQQLDSLLLKTLLQEVETVQARVQLNQFSMLKEPDTPSSPTASWLIDLPVKEQRHIDFVRLQIEQFNHQDQGDVWRVQLRLDTEKLGPVAVQLSLRAGALQVMLSVEHQHSASRLEQDLALLKKALDKLGLSVTHLSCRCEPVPAPTLAQTVAESSQQLVDVSI